MRSTQYHPCLPHTLPHTRMQQHSTARLNPASLPPFLPPSLAPLRECARTHIQTCTRSRSLGLAYTHTHTHTCTTHTPADTGRQNARAAPLAVGTVLPTRVLPSVFPLRYPQSSLGHALCNRRVPRRDNEPREDGRGELVGDFVLRILVPVKLRTRTCAKTRTHARAHARTRARTVAPPALLSTVVQALPSAAAPATTRVPHPASAQYPCVPLPSAAAAASTFGRLRRFI
jgi:hypothetical protein